MNAALIHALGRIQLAQLPTPLEELPRLSRLLGGPTILVKRDDQTGLAFGGNKTRKLEFLMAEALALRSTVVLTAGAAQSNHCRQTAAAAARVGLKCELILGGSEPELPNGNLLLDRLCGAATHWTSMDRRIARMAERAAELEGRGERPYTIPYGGSNGVGAVGFALAMLELSDQLAVSGRTLDTIVLASSSGGTQAGLVVGACLAGFSGTILGISIDKGEGGEEPYPVELARITNETAARISLDRRFTPVDFTVNYDYLGAGYGVVGDLEREAIRLLAQHEGILLDPVYTGRAMGGLIDLIRKGSFSRSQTLLFWHTGGGPALFAYARDLL